jgi:hypothetical protein
MVFVWGNADVDEADFVDMGFGDEAVFVTRCGFFWAIMGFFGG